MSGQTVTVNAPRVIMATVALVVLAVVAVTVAGYVGDADGRRYDRRVDVEFQSCVGAHPDQLDECTRTYEQRKTHRP